MIADWRVDPRDGLAHAFPSGYGYVFRSACGDVRWTVALVVDEKADRCATCADLVDAGVVPAARPGPADGAMTPDMKRRVMRRRWHEAHGHF